jgi:ABC-2 type transport system permease protein
MSRFITILRFEWQWLLRYRLFLPVAVLLLITGSCALYYGHAVVQERKKTLKEIYSNDVHRFDSLVHKLATADTMTREGKGIYKQLSHPAVVQFQLKPAAVLPAAPLSMLSLGMSDVAAYYHRLDVNWSYLYSEEKINNPLKLLTGNIDLSFLLVYIFPLLLVGISYNIVSREQEQGTLSLLLVQGAKLSTLLPARMLIRWMLFFFLFMLLAATAAVIQGNGWLDLLPWALVTAAYTLFWCMLIMLIAVFKRSSAFNIAMMITAWILLLILLPALFRLAAENRKMTTQTATIAAEQREQEWALWDMPKKALLDSFYGRYPLYRDAGAYDTSAASSRRLMAYYDMVTQRMDRFVAGDEAIRRQEQANMAASYYYNPAVYTQSLLNQVAHTDVTDYSHYEREIKEFHQQWKSYFFPFFFRSRALSPADYTRIPVFHHTPVSTGPSLLQGTLYLFFLSAIMGIAAIYLLNKHDHH